MSYLTLLNQIACVTKEIADNGFTPTDPVQVFIDSLLPFAPDALFIGDTIVGGVGSGVNSWADSSGNGNDTTVFGVPDPVVSALTPNGRKSVSFVTSMFSVPLANAGSTGTAIGVIRNIQASQVLGGRIIVGVPSNLSHDYDTEGYIFGYFDNPNTVGIYHNASVGSSIPVADATFLIFSSVADGTTARLRVGAATISAAYAGTPFAILHHGIGASDNPSGTWFTGDIPFAFIKTAALSPADEASVLALVNAYYGL